MKRTGRLSSWLALVPQAALVCAGVGALRFVEALVSPPPGAASRLGSAVLAAGLFWLTAAILGLVALAVRRGSGAPPGRKPPAPAAPLSREMRLRGWGFSLVAGWGALGLLALIVMADTGTGPFARLATGVLGVRGPVRLATFLLGLPVLMAPLAVLAVLPWQTRWPLLAGMQAAVKPGGSARHPRKRR